MARKQKKLSREVDASITAFLLGDDLPDSTGQGDRCDMKEAGR